MRPFYFLFTDGSCSRKFNTIGSGFILFKKDEQNSELKNFYPLKTGGQGWKGTFKNGAAELLGIYKGLEFLLKEGLEKETINVYSDSQYALNELNSLRNDHLQRKYCQIGNSAIIIRILFLLEQFPKISFNWIKGHQKSSLEDFYVFGNNEADKIAVSQHREEDSSSKQNLEDFWEFYKELDQENKKYNLLTDIYNYYLLRNRIRL